MSLFNMIKSSHSKDSLISKKEWFFLILTGLLAAYGLSLLPEDHILNELTPFLPLICLLLVLK
jgi:hypothetical protein